MTFHSDFPKMRLFPRHVPQGKSRIVPLWKARLLFSGFRRVVFFHLAAKFVRLGAIAIIRDGTLVRKDERINRRMDDLTLHERADAGATACAKQRAKGTILPPVNHNGYVSRSQTSRHLRVTKRLYMRALYRSKIDTASHITDPLTNLDIWISILGLSSCPRKMFLSIQKYLTINHHSTMLKISVLNGDKI